MLQRVIEFFNVAGPIFKEIAGDGINLIANQSLGDHGHTGGTDNDLIDLGLNDHSTADGGSDDVIGLGLNLFEDGNEASGSVAGGNIDLLNDQGLGHVDLNLGGMDLLDISLTGDTAQNSIIDLDLSHLAGNLLGGSDCDTGGLDDTLNIDLSILDDAGSGVVHGMDGLLGGLHNDTSHLAADHGSSGPALGSLLGLGAWV